MFKFSAFIAIFAWLLVSPAHALDGGRYGDVRLATPAGTPRGYVVLYSEAGGWTAADQAGEAVVAAVYLYALTGDAQFQDYVKAHYRDARSYRDMGWSRYNAEQGEALLYYTTLANADAATKTAILADKAADVSAGNQIYGFRPRDDLYRAYLHDAQYHWGRASIQVAFTIFVLLALVSSAVLSLRGGWGVIAVRVLGSWTAATGLLFVGWTLHGRS